MQLCTWCFFTEVPRKETQCWQWRDRVIFPLSESLCLSLTQFLPVTWGFLRICPSMKVNFSNELHIQSLQISPLRPGHLFNQNESPTCWQTSQYVMNIFNPDLNSSTCPEDGNMVPKDTQKEWRNLRMLHSEQDRFSGWLPSMGHLLVA